MPPKSCPFTWEISRIILALGLVCFISKSLRACERRNAFCLLIPLGALLFEKSQHKSVALFPPSNLHHSCEPFLELARLLQEGLYMP